MAENEKVEQSVSSAPKADKAKKDKKSEKKSKPGVFARIGRWFRELKIELKKIVVGIFIWLFDAVAGGLIQALFHLVNG